MKEYKETDRKKNAWREIEEKLGYEEGNECLCIYILYLVDCG